MDTNTATITIIRQILRRIYFSKQLNHKYLLSSSLQLTRNTCIIAFLFHKKKLRTDVKDMPTQISILSSASQIPRILRVCKLFINIPTSFFFCILFYYKTNIRFASVSSECLKSVLVKSFIYYFSVIKDNTSVVCVHQRRWKLSFKPILFYIAYETPCGLVSSGLRTGVWLVLHALSLTYFWYRNMIQTYTFETTVSVPRVREVQGTVSFRRQTWTPTTLTFPALQINANPRKSVGKCLP